jgi:hypothetical protein
MRRFFLVDSNRFGRGRVVGLRQGPERPIDKEKPMGQMWLVRN